MYQRLMKPLALFLLVVLLGGCAAKGRLLMPTPMLYVSPDGVPVYALAPGERLAPDVDLFYITDREPESNSELGLPYGEQRGRRIIFGSATVRMTPDITWESLLQQSRLRDRTQEVDLELGPVSRLGEFPREPYRITRAPSGDAFRDADQMAQHRAATRQFHAEVEQRLALSPRKEILLYVHGFNETFASAAFTTAELCHFLGREQVCSFFTWPASASGNFLTSYTATTESATYSVDHLKKAIRLLAQTPGVERVQILAHSRGTALTLDAVQQLFLEAIAAGTEPIDAYKIDNIVLLSPDIDVDIAGQKITSWVSDPDLVSVWPSGRLPRGISGRLSLYSSPEDRALLVSRILFRSRFRAGSLTAKDLTPQAQQYLLGTAKIDLITYEGKRTDLFGHSYFTSNPEVSSDLIQMIRYGKRLGEPGRQLIKTGPVTWEFPRTP